MNVSFQLRRLVFQFARDIFTNAVHGAATTRTGLFFGVQVVLVANLTQLVPIDFPFLRRRWRWDFNFGFFARGRGVFRRVCCRRGQVEQMALPCPFGESLSSSTKCPTLVPGQFVQRGGVRLLQLFDTRRPFRPTRGSVPRPAAPRRPLAAALRRLLLQLYRLAERRPAGVGGSGPDRWEVSAYHPIPL